MNLRKSASLLVCALALGLVPAAPAQCFLGDDGFDLGCCAPPVPNLPAFPAVTMLADYGVLTGCQQLFVVPPFTVNLSAPTFLLCDLAIINVNIAFGGGNNISGFLVAKYVRTWQDFSSPVLSQVYRFLVNGDLLCTSGSSITACGTIFPRCAAFNPAVHFDGHVDYSCDPTTFSNFVASFSLNHMQGCISHAPWSCVPIGGVAGHDEVSYHIVGPAPFNFISTPPAQGPILADSVRTTRFRLFPNFQYQCFSEQRVPNVVGANFLSTSFGPYCSCAIFEQCSSMPLSCLAPTQCFYDQSLQGLVCCPGPTGTYQSVPIGGTPIANTGLLAQSVGSWGGGTLYPNMASLTIYFGVLSYTDPCGQANWPIHGAVGVAVSGVFHSPYSTSTSCSPPFFFAQTALDLQNTLPINNVSLPPGYGCLSVPDVVWSFSM